MYLVFALPGLVFSLWATFYVKSTFAKYATIGCASGMTGAEAARRMLDWAGLRGVKVRQTEGLLSDHYDPMARELRLSPEVYQRSSLAAIGVACHEAGHALQHAEGYALLGLRSTLVPVVNIGSHLSYIVLMIGMLLHRQPLILAGALLFSLVVLFSIVTLPVEWNASARARVAMVQAGIVTGPERDHAWEVLKAAFLTYVAAAVSALLTLLYYLWRAGLFGGRRDE
jgi:hypothetical protein